MFDLLIRGGTVIDGTGRAGFTADVGIRDGVVAEVGRLSGGARRVVDADGLNVTPGFLDIHTHYDGQATWDPQLDPSFSSGVTTAIMGNCGVGFAPVRPGEHERLVQLMEGVEEIPGTALEVGMKWNWSSFPEYLDVLDQMPRTFDVGAMIPHGPLRWFVMGDKVGTDKCADSDDLDMMLRLTHEAMEAGAIGMATSRTPLHRTSIGEMTPDYNVDQPELTALARAVASHGRIFQVAPAGLTGEDYEGLQSEMALLDQIVRETGVTLHVLMFQTSRYSHYWREQLSILRKLNEEGKGRAYAQIGGRSIGAVVSFFGSHPFMDRPTFDEIRKLPRGKWLETLAKPEVRAKLMGEPDRPGGFGEFLNSYFDRFYDLGPDINYEPDESMSMVTLAAQRGVSPSDAVYDMLLRTGEEPRLFQAVTNYATGNFDNLREALLDPTVVLGASDAGAHVQSVCDGSIHSFMLAHWARDRSRGEKLPLEFVINLMTQRCADSVGLFDRGVIAPGMKADINIFDLDAIKVQPPRMFDDLPGGAIRMMQPVTGYHSTMVSGVVTRENDEATGALPGRLARPASGPVRTPLAA